ncbi:MAG: hypothetical protein AAF533_28170 [Acidobacteriota bacterium]
MKIPLVLFSLLLLVVPRVHADRARLGDRVVPAVVPSGPSWPLPIPSPGEITELSQLRGVLLETEGSTYQVDELQLQVGLDGQLGLAGLRGWDRAGNLLVRELGSPKGRIVSSLDELGTVRLGSPARPEERVDADLLAFGVDAEGYLSVVELIGRRVGTGERVERSRHPDPSESPCGERVVIGCHNVDCTGYCTPFPECGCVGSSGPLGITGHCLAYMETSCAGWCPTGSVCARNARGCDCLDERLMDE